MFDVEQHRSRKNHLDLASSRKRGIMCEKPIYQDITTTLYTSKDGEITINFEAFSRSKKPTKNIHSAFEMALKQLPDSYKHQVEEIFFSVYGDASFDANQLSFIKKVQEHIEKHTPNNPAHRTQLLLFAVHIFPGLFE
ncbi:MAG: hypothetical protein QG639_46 [Patescibacteria group bacterium]|nr:hypothetical protein [Patescibacteria group bacterium]